MAQAYAGEPGCVCVSATVAAVVRRLRGDGGETEHSGPPLRCNAWEVVVPELMFEPVG